MSRRVKRPLAKRKSGDRPKGSPPYRDAVQGRRKDDRRPPEPRAPRASKGRAGHSSVETRPYAPLHDGARIEPAAPLPTKVQTVVVTADEANMRVDRFLEARFPG